jgi:hypothetical protein
LGGGKQMKQDTLTENNIPIASETKYSSFTGDFVTGVNKRLAKFEESLYELGVFIVIKCDEGEAFGKTKDEIFKDLCSHPNFKYSKHTLF